MRSSLAESLAGGAGERPEKPSPHGRKAKVAAAGTAIAALLGLTYGTYHLIKNHIEKAEDSTKITSETDLLVATTGIGKGLVDIRLDGGTFLVSPKKSPCIVFEVVHTKNPQSTPDDPRTALGLLPEPFSFQHSQGYIKYDTDEVITSKAGLARYDAFLDGVTCVMPHEDAAKK